MITTTTIDNQEEKVEQGIDFLLSHFEGRQRLFPRKMSTFATKGKQFTVYNKEQILDACIKSNFKDCRLNAYPVLEDGLLQAPNIIFIDLDLQSNLNELKKYLDKTLKIIKQKISGFEPTVLWSGNGYHVYIVLDVRPLELIEELKILSDKPSEQFLRFAESVFTNKMKDSCHNPSFQSCLLRIPGTYNSKNGEVKIVQRYDANKIPTIDHQLLREFRLYIADNEIKRKINFRQKYHALKTNADSNNIPKCYRWIEDKLLKTPIPDYRKITVDLILVPFFIVIKKFSANQSFDLIKQYLIKCHKLQPLLPSVNEFERRVKFAIGKSKENKIPPIKIENIRNRYPKWYNSFNQ